MSGCRQRLTTRLRRRPGKVSIELSWAAWTMPPRTTYSPASVYIPPCPRRPVLIEHEVPARSTLARGLAAGWRRWQWTVCARNLTPGAYEWLPAVVLVAVLVAEVLDWGRRSTGLDPLAFVKLQDAARDRP